MYLIIQSRWIRGSDQNGENIVGIEKNKKQALGQLVSQTYSHFEMMRKHNYFDCHEVEGNIETHEIVGADAIGIKYRIKYFLLEVNDAYRNSDIEDYMETHNVL